MLETPLDIRVQTLAQLQRGGDWRLRLPHDLPHHLLVWITRGQGLMLLDGVRRGLGAHNAIFVPSGTLFAMELGRQSVLQAVVLPEDTPVSLPAIPRHLRIRDVQPQGELTALIDAAAREDLARRPLRADAMAAHAALISVWLRRQILLDEHQPRRRNAAERLSAAFCARVSQRYTSGATMADYAAHLGVTPTHLTRAVKAATGRTAADLLADRVLHEARRLLIETPEPAQNIARYLGFGSAAYFTRFIQRHTGHPPSKLRSG